MRISQKELFGLFPKFLRVTSLPLYGWHFRDRVLLLIATFRFIFLSIAQKIGTTQATGYALSQVVPETYLKVDQCVFKVRRHSDDVIFLQPFHEQLTTRKIAKLTHDGVFIDAGAHVGRYSILAAKKLRGRGRVIAVEPNEGNFEALLENIELNHLHNVIAVKEALYDRNCSLALYSDGVPGSGFSSLMHKRNKRTKVRCISMDSLLRTLKICPSEVRVVKMDVEGAEYFAFKGAKRFLKYGNATIIFEAGPKTLKKCERLLGRFGYKVGMIADENFFARKCSP